MNYGETPPKCHHFEKTTPLPRGDFLGQISVPSHTLAIFFERMTLLENQFQYNCRWLSQRDFTVYCLQVSLFHLGSFHTVLVVYLKVAATLRLCARYITLTCALQVYLKNLELHAFSMQKCRRYTCNAQINMNQRCRVATPL